MSTSDMPNIPSGLLIHISSIKTSYEIPASFFPTTKDENFSVFENYFQDDLTRKLYGLDPLPKLVAKPKKESPIYNKGGYRAVAIKGTGGKSPIYAKSLAVSQASDDDGDSDLSAISDAEKDDNDDDDCDDEHDHKQSAKDSQREKTPCSGEEEDVMDSGEVKRPEEEADESEVEEEKEPPKKKKKSAIPHIKKRPKNDDDDFAEEEISDEEPRTKSPAPSRNKSPALSTSSKSDSTKRRNEASPEPEKKRQRKDLEEREEPKKLTELTRDDIISLTTENEDMIKHVTTTLSTLLKRYYDKKSAPVLSSNQVKSIPSIVSKSMSGFRALVTIFDKDEIFIQRGKINKTAIPELYLRATSSALPVYEVLGDIVNPDTKIVAADIAKIKTTSFVGTFMRICAVLSGLLSDVVLSFLKDCSAWSSSLTTNRKPAPISLSNTNAAFLINFIHYTLVHIDLLAGGADTDDAITKTIEFNINTQRVYFAKTFYKTQTRDGEIASKATASSITHYDWKFPECAFNVAKMTKERQDKNFPYRATCEFLADLLDLVVFVCTNKE